MATEKYIESTLSNELRDLGYRKQKSYWYLDLGKTIVNLNIERRGPLRLIGFGVWFKIFGVFERPAMEEFHWGGFSRHIDSRYFSRNKWFDYGDKTLSPEKKILENQR